MAQRKKFALVTGCGQGGIGEALVKEYQTHGISAIATVLPSESRVHLTEAGITCFSLDVTKEESVKELKKIVAAITGGHLDILVNNAGIAYTMTAIDTDVKEVQYMFDVNIFGPMRMVRWFHDMLIKSSGTIVNIGSVAGISPYVYGSSYNATKAALHHWSNTLRVEMAPLNVKVLTIISGEIGTNILKRDTSRELPEGSYFAPLSEEFKKHVQRIPNTTNRFDYASKVVAESIKSQPTTWFWYGKTTLIVRFLDTFLWRRVWDYMFWNTFNFAKLQRVSLEARKKID
ncbi:NAD(P)-binding protein [Cryphonectria parasitica EP155]|uniref:NAD(P)-binding protein n=1 Tax=Cryphonectria parasitica (strain ATCC 38755 / EP155) TaxID=660469 RepID=A0A9P4Y5V9_CRYP1|nr:NAD(P)-binding protein [Cryphonectria parasitica EP155]KAF3766680.1 NAD(P)-binding protein [Cryphonectria parasitica EP155]